MASCTTKRQPLPCRGQVCLSWKGSTDEEWMCSHFFGWAPITGHAPYPKCRKIVWHLCLSDSLLPTGEAWGGGRKARPAEVFLRVLSTFSIQLANSQFHAKYGVLPTGATAQPYPGLAASSPVPAPSPKLAQGLTSKHKTFLHMSPHAHTAWTKQPVLE